MPLLRPAVARLALVAALAAGAAACSDESPSATPRPTGAAAPTTVAELPTTVAELPTTVAELPTTVAELPTTVAELPAPAAEFLAGAAGDDARFTADYRVLRKLGSVTSEVHVEQDPPWTVIEVGDLVVVDGPRPATCLRSVGRCVGQVREQELAERGFFSGFATTGPRQAIETMAARADAGFSTATRTAAGVTLECLRVSVSGTPAAEWCLTPEGAFGYVDTVVQRVELLAYEAVADVDGEPPGELVADDDFLTS